MDERDDMRALTLAPTPHWLAAESLRPVHELNRRLIAILIDESRRRETTPVTTAFGRLLAPHGEELLTRLATIPICLVDAGFQLDEPWSALAAGARTHTVPLSESPLPRARALELASLTFALASSTARESLEAARVIFGMTPTVANAMAGLSVDIVHWLGQARAHWIRPRWQDAPAVWRRLIATAELAETARLAPVSVRAMNRLLADLERATGAASETRRSRR